MPLQPFVPHRSALMPKAMRNSSLFRRMIRGSWVRETERCEGGAAPAVALIVKTAKRASGIIFMGDFLSTAHGEDCARRQYSRAHLAATNDESLRDAGICSCVALTYRAIGLAYQISPPF